MSESVRDYGLRPLWDAILPIYREFRGICERHRLRHWAAFGTALGAARHRGFIPWDDDFDVMMPREDYERFMEVAEDELPRHLRTVNWRKTDGYNWLFGKVQDVRRDNLERVESRLGRVLPQGIYMDVFPCDGYPSDGLTRALRRLDGLALCAKREFRACPKGKRWHPRRLAMRVLGAVSPFYRHCHTLRDFAAANDRRMRRSPFADSELVVTCEVRFSLGLTWTVYPAEIFRETTELPFEGMTMPVVRDYERYLSIEFGDWRKLPSEGSRLVTHANEELAPWRCA